MKNYAVPALLSLLLSALLLSACQVTPAETQPAPPPTTAPAQPIIPAAKTAPVEPSLPTPLPSATRTLRPSSTPIPTATALASFTPRPTATITPTPTEAPALSESRPYLVYYGQSGGQPALFLQNDDGNGRRVLPLPTNSRPPDLPDALSPDSQWLVLYTGSAGDSQALSKSKGPFDVALNLVHLPDGKITTVTSLLPGGFPQGLKQIARQAAQKQPSGGASEAQIYDEVWQRFLTGVVQARWSPDGQSLAFAGQMEGPSLDLYLYDLATGKTRRAASGEEQLQWLHWSPDGQYILHGRANRTCNNDCVRKYALSVSSGDVRELTNLVGQGGPADFYDWPGPHTLTFFTSTTSQEAGNLKNIDVATNETSDLYPGSFVTLQFDPNNQLLALFLDIDGNPPKQIEEGVYLYRIGSGQRDLVAPSTKYGRLLPVYWGNPLYPFLLWNEQKVYGLAADGSVNQLAEGRYWGISRNRQMVVVGDAKPDAPGLLIIDASGQVLRQASAARAGDLFWNTTSTGLFSVYEGGLYYLDLQAADWVQIDSSLPAKNWSGPTQLLFGWKR